MPWRHSFFLNDLCNHVGPTSDFLVIGQCKGSDFTVAVALRAMLVQNRRDLSAIGHRAGWVYFFRPADDATSALGARLADLFASQKFIDCHLKIFAARLVACMADTVLVIDSTSVSQLPFVVVQVDFRSAFCVKRICEFVPRVLEDHVF